MPGRKTAIGAKVRVHFRRLLKPIKLQGLWNWRSVAMHIRGAGIPLQTGTNPCERFWSRLIGMMPPQSRNISLRWFRVLASLAFLKHNYTHYNSSFLPSWCRRDSMLAERIDSIVVLVRELEGQETAARLLYEPFVS